MANDADTPTFYEDTRFDGPPQVALVGLMSVSDVSAADIKSHLDGLFYRLFTTASNGMVLQAGLDALHGVRSTWSFMEENTDELSRTVFYMQLADRILHDASIYGLGQTHRYALAVRELVFNLNFAYRQDEPTPLNLSYLRRKLICLLDQLDTHMQPRGIRRLRIDYSQPLTFSNRFPDTMPDCRTRYANLCAFTGWLTRENIDIFAWEDIMATAFNRARNNMPARMPTPDNGDRLDTCKAYLSGAEAWVNYDIIRKSLRNRRISREAWREWQDMFTEANSATTSRGFRNTPSSLPKASREIERALEAVNDHDEARRTRGSHTPAARLSRIPART